MEAFEIRVSDAFLLCLVPVRINTMQLLEITGERQLIIDFNKSIVHSCLALSLLPFSHTLEMGADKFL